MSASLSSLASLWRPQQHMEAWFMSQRETGLCALSLWQLPTRKIQNHTPRLKSTVNVSYGELLREPSGRKASSKGDCQDCIQESEGHQRSHPAVCMPLGHKSDFDLKPQVPGWPLSCIPFSCLKSGHTLWRPLGPRWLVTAHGHKRNLQTKLILAFLTYISPPRFAILRSLKLHPFSCSFWKKRRGGCTLLKMLYKREL